MFLVPNGIVRTWFVFWYDKDDLEGLMARLGLSEENLDDIVFEYEVQLLQG